MQTVLSTPELLEQVLLQANYETTINLCLTNHLAYGLCSHPTFWAQKALLQYNVPLNIFQNTHLSPHDRYLQIRGLHGDLFPNAEKYLGSFEYALTAIKYNKRRELEHILNKEKDNEDFEWNGLMETALETNNPEFFDLIYRFVGKLNYVPNWSFLVYASVRSGNPDLFNSVRSLVNTPFWDDWDRYALSALQTGNSAMFNHILTHAPSSTVWNWQYLAEAATASGKIFLLETVLSLAPQDYIFNWNEIAKYGGAFGSIDILEFLVQNVSGINWNEIAQVAMKNKNSKVLNWIQQQI